MDQAALLEHYRRRERELLALQETAFDLNRSRDTSAVLSAIVHRTRGVIGSDISYMSAYDPERSDFFMRAIEGALSPRFGEIRVPSSLGSCQPIVSDLQPFVTDNYREDPRFVHDPMVDRALDAEGIVSMAGVPLLLDGRVLGILYVADRYPRTYGPHEISLLLSLGAHAALAMENARLFEETRQAVQRLEATTAEVESAIRVHEQLIALVAGGQGKEALVGMMSSTLDACMMILDADDNLLCAHAPDALSISNPRTQLSKGSAFRPYAAAVQESRHTGRSAAVDIPDGACRAMAIGSGEQILGVLVAVRAHAFSNSDIRTFERAALVTGVVLLSEERIARSLDRDFEEALRSLVGGNRDARSAVSRHADRHGLDTDQPMALLLADPAGRSLGLVLRIVHEQASVRAVAGELDGLAVAFCPAAKAETLAAVLQETLSRRAAARPTIVISRPFEDLANFPALYAAARRCLTLLAALGRRGATASESILAPYAVLFEGRSQSEIADFITSKIGRLIAFDEMRGAHLVPSLASYLESGLDVAVAARSMNIHKNTMRQRLGKICDLLNISDISADLFEIHMAVKMRQLMTVLT